MNLNIVALIPARSGSKGIPNKNIKLYKGKPLMVHSIDIANKSKYITDVYVSTDSIEYQNIALQNGAKILWLRNESISGDLSPDIDTFTDFLKWCVWIEIKIPDIIVHLRPTYPNRCVSLLDDCIEKFIEKYNNYDSLRTVVPLNKSPYKMYYIDKDKNNLIPYFKEHHLFKEPFNQARQNFPDSYLHNGCIDIIKTEIIQEYNLLSGNKILPYIMNESETNDIDYIEDFINSENKF